jgi:ADP-ribosylglycohydrolase
VDGLVFDIGIQTSAALDRLERGIPPSDSGLAGERNNGNGSLMRTLPVALLHEGDDASLASLAQAHSRVTHAHPRSQACCATYALWARYEILHDADPWSSAIESLHAIYPDGSALAMELDGIASASSNVPTGTGYVVDCLLSAKRACEENSYDAIVRTAISLGHDTDTTACVAGGIAGIRHGKIGIPSRWLNALRGREILRPLLEQVHSRLSSGPSHGGV